MKLDPKIDPNCYGDAPADVPSNDRDCQSRLDPDHICIPEIAQMQDVGSNVYTFPIVSFIKANAPANFPIDPKVFAWYYWLWHDSLTEIFDRVHYQEALKKSLDADNAAGLLDRVERLEHRVNALVDAETPAWGSLQRLRNDLAHLEKRIIALEKHFEDKDVKAPAPDPDANPFKDKPWTDISPYDDWNEQRIYNRINERIRQLERKYDSLVLPLSRAVPVSLVDSLDNYRARGL